MTRMTELNPLTVAVQMDPMEGIKIGGIRPSTSCWRRRRGGIGSIIIWRRT
ncbi:hypothetical protein SBA_ch1_00070 [Sphingomonas bisphenolicum]|uniref:Uncharacterized protein n=1 Tax=Sphingomonas bisphenolicum TaxID=296544 RepID=A0ABN5WA34_9SPHN|nr:hypothetical protein SBA_ch1_00070 [Sphingomonas bisphenolicum]